MKNNITDKVWYKKPVERKQITFDSLTGDALLYPLLFLKSDGTCDSCNLFVKAGMICVSFDSNEQSYWELEGRSLKVVNQKFFIELSTHDSLILIPDGNKKSEVWKRIVL